MNENDETGHEGARDMRTLAMYLACGSLMVMILVLDLLTPLGIAVSVCYVAVVLISLWSPRMRFTVLVGVVCSVLTVGLFFYKPMVAEMWKVVLNRALALFAIWVTVYLGLQRKALEAKREKALREREKALDEVRILRGFLPICASCKKIRDDQGYWTQIESYIKTHSEANFSHGVCPECAKKLYPEFYQEEKRDADNDV